MNRISPLLQKLSELYLSKVRNQYLQDGVLQDGDIDIVMRQTRSAYSELLEWQRTMSEIDAVLLHENGAATPEFHQQLPPTPPPAARPARAAAPPPPPPPPAPPAPQPEPVQARPTFTPFAEPEIEDHTEPMLDYEAEESESPYFTGSSLIDEDEEVIAPPAPPKPAARPVPAAEVPMPQPRPKVAATASSSVSDIRELVSVNDKYLFVSELFNHNRTAYEKAMEAINKFRSRIQATNWVNALVKKEYKWEDDSPTAKAFYKVINQYFAAK